MTRTSIEWATDSWNPIAAYDRETGKRGWFCTKVSPGCTNCYAEQWNRFRGNGHLYRAANLDRVRFELAPTLTDPLHWRKPRRVFVNSMTDLFLPQHTGPMLDQVVGVMAWAQHQFLVLTKRAEEMLAYSAELASLTRQQRGVRIARSQGWTLPDDTPGGMDWPLPNVWFGVSVENQEEADHRIPLLIETPAAIRFLSCEPLLGPLAFPLPCNGSRFWSSLHWMIVGGESGSKAREFDMGWARDIVAQCHNGGVACFVKQMGSKAIDPWADTGALIGDRAPAVPKFRDRKGGDPSEWPTELRVRQYPKEAAHA